MPEFSLWEKIEPLLTFVEHPSRYIGHEYHAISPELEDDPDTDFRVALLYPDTYELGQSNQAIAILYHLINAQQGYLAERAFLPWVDMISLMRSRAIPLFTLESFLPVGTFDLFGITLPHELSATNILEALDLADIPLHSQDRSTQHPIVLGGGPAAFNPEPLSPFFDAFVLGEGEEVILEILNELQDCKQRGSSRNEKLIALAGIDGVYVPSFYEPDETGILIPHRNNVPARVTKRVIKDFAAFPVITEPIVPYTEVAHDRFTIEILRGCSRGCRFCQGGMIYRPVRERFADTIVDAVARGLAQTGYDEVSLVSLSSTDHSQIRKVLRRLNHLLAGCGTSISIPSQRIDAFGVDLAQLIAGEKKAGLTFAPEAGTQRLRDSINKNVTEADLIEAITYSVELGWRRCKLYFMIGLPGETDDDIRGIVELSNKAFDAAKEALPDDSKGSFRMTVSVAVFIPKPHTPFQWCGQISTDEMDRRIEILRSARLHKGIDLHWHDPAASRIEAALSRAGREAASLIEQAWNEGALFDAWSDRFHEELWVKAAENSGVNINGLAQRDLDVNGTLPWDHIDAGIDKEFLAREFDRSREGITSNDCSFDFCLSCGACTKLDAKIQLGRAR